MARNPRHRYGALALSHRRAADACLQPIADNGAAAARSSWLAGRRIAAAALTAATRNRRGLLEVTNDRTKAAISFVACRQLSRVEDVDTPTSEIEAKVLPYSASRETARLDDAAASAAAAADRDRAARSTTAADFALLDELR